MADNRIGQTEQQLARLQLVGPVVDVQLDAPFYANRDEKTIQFDCIITIRSPLQTVDYRKVIIYIIKDVLTVLKILYIHRNNVLFSMFFPFLLFAKLVNNRENRMSHTSSDLFDMSFIAK